MSGYLFFKKTGEPLIDNITNCLERAGNAYHNTSNWQDRDDGEPSQVDLIREAVDKAALDIAHLRSIIEQQVKEIDALKDKVALCELTHYTLEPMNVHTPPTEDEE